MTTFLLYAVLAIIVIAVIFVVLTRFLPAGEQVAAPVRDEPLWELPPGAAFGADEVISARLPVSVRGYRFAETDRLLDRVADGLRARDARIVQLEQQLGYRGAPAEVELQPAAPAAPAIQQPTAYQPEPESGPGPEPEPEPEQG